MSTSPEQTTILLEIFKARPNEACSRARENPLATRAIYILLKSISNVRSNRHSTLVVAN